MEGHMAVDNIHDAAVQGLEDEVRRLVACDPSALNATQPPLGATPLMWACFHGKASTARVLLSLGADLHVKGSRGICALLLACRRGHWPVVQLLLAQGADPCVCVEDGSHVLMHAASGGSVPIVRALLQHTRHQVNVCSGRGYSALSWACSAGHADVAQVLLLEGGARPELCNVLGKGPIHVAQHKGHHNCVQLLQWFESELCRSLMLCKARAIADLSLTLCQRPHHSPLPPYLAQRRTHTQPLPTLTLHHTPSLEKEKAFDVPPLLCPTSPPSSTPQSDQHDGLHLELELEDLEDQGGWLKGEGLKRKWEGLQEARDGPHSPSRLLLLLQGQGQGEEGGTQHTGHTHAAEAFYDADEEGEGEGEEGGVCVGVVLRHVVRELSNDVFSELLQFIKVGQWADNTPTPSPSL